MPNPSSPPTTQKAPMPPWPEAQAEARAAAMRDIQASAAATAAQQAQQALQARSQFQSLKKGRCHKTADKGHTSARSLRFGNWFSLQKGRSRKGKHWCQGLNYGSTGLISKSLEFPGSAQTNESAHGSGAAAASTRCSGASAGAETDFACRSARTLCNKLRTLGSGTVDLNLRP